METSILHLVSSEYLDAYTSSWTQDRIQVLQTLRAKPEFTTEDFEHYLVTSSLYSSKIEGNTLDANSFFRHRGVKGHPRQKELEEIEDLVEAYRFAAENTLSRTAFFQTHAIASRTLLPVRLRGKARKQPVGVRDVQTSRPVYLAVEPEWVDREVDKHFSDISELLARDLSPQEVFYYASMIHLWTAMIHPFLDGNGRCARLLEKWFLVSKLGRSAWSIASEKYYWDHRPDYYRNIALGYNYYALHWERCMPFLSMLPDALAHSS